MPEQWLPDKKPTSNANLDLAPEGVKTFNMHHVQTTGSVVQCLYQKKEHVMKVCMHAIGIAQIVDIEYVHRYTIRSLYIECISHTQACL